MLGKHLRTVRIILTSFRTPKHTSKARILTLDTMVLGLAFTPACNRNLRLSMRPIKRKKIVHTYAMIIQV
jgi:hypothetical protein